LKKNLRTPPTLSLSSLSLSFFSCNDIGVLTYFRIAANMTHAGAKALNARAVDLDLQCGKSSDVWAYDKVADAVQVRPFYFL
jgi:hypothetical protein|tara:strand:- start:459 stop:704 length:246 start_codon:yes stop_codon:yes gene_type:complete